jgi:iron complex outermembrane receptor protein
MNSTSVAAISAALLLGATPAYAEEAQLDEIVVTATKRETNIQKTPIAISVVSEKSLEDRHVGSLLDLSDGSVPGLTVQTFEARQSALTIGIRGIVPLDANQPAREQGVGVYVDGVYLGRQHGLNASLLDLERIEVLKGPQGTLFGRNTEGGALSMVTKKPTGNFEGNANATIGSYGTRGQEIHLNLPEFAYLSTKYDFIYQHQDATTKNPLEAQTGWNYFDRIGGRISARFAPPGDFKADIAADYGRDKNSPFYSQLLNYNPLGLTGLKPLPAMVVVAGTERMKVADIGVPQQPSVDTVGGVYATLAYDLGSTELKSITAWRFVDATQWDNSGGAHRLPVAVPNGVFSRYSLATLNQTQWSQELQAVGSIGDKIDYVAGVYYFTESVKDDAATPSTNKWNATLTGYTINDLTNTLPGNRFLDRQSNAKNESIAAFGQAIYSPIDTLHITLGGRYTSDSKSGALTRVSNIATNLTYEQKTHRFNPLVIVAYEANDNINAYVKYATGYRSGGASSRSITYRSFGPEDVKSYELGLKMQSDNARLNIAAYKMDRQNSQIDFSNVQYDPVTKTTRNTLETINAPGTTKIEGIEVEGTYKIGDLTLTGAYTFTDTKVPPTMNPFKNVVQPVFIVFTPKNVYNLGADYALGKISFHVDGTYQDATQTFDQYAITNDASFITNASVKYEINDRLNLKVFARNALNETHVYRRDPSNASTLGDYGNLNTPRIVGATLNAKW